jgi:hypothetical protein
MEYEKELDGLTEHTEKIMQINDTERKVTGLHNLLNRVKNAVSDVITDNAEAIKSNSGGWRFNQYIQNVKWSVCNSRYNDIIRFVNDHITDIATFESDTPEQAVERKNKLKEYSDVISISPPIKKIIRHMRIECYNEVIYDENPDIIYIQSGTYRLFDEYSNKTYWFNSFYCLCLNIKRNFEFSNQDFDSVCRLVCLYMAIKNELQIVIDEMQLLGMAVPETFLPDTEPDKAKPQQQITIPDEVLQWLQTTISKNSNGKAFVKKYNGKLKWLQNKQNARVLLTHEAIRGNLSKNKAITQATILFVYGDNNEPLKLGSDDKRQENTNTTDLRNYLNGLKNPTA